MGRESRKNYVEGSERVDRVVSPFDRLSSNCSRLLGTSPSPQPPYPVRGRLSPTTGEGVRGFTAESAEGERK